MCSFSSNSNTFKEDSRISAKDPLVLMVCPGGYFLMLNSTYLTYENLFASSVEL